MKKILSIIMIFSLLFISNTTIFANPQYNQQIYVKVNGETISFPDAKPYISSSGRTMVPIRFVANALGLNTSWNGKTQKATIVSETTSVILKANSVNGIINGRNVSFDVAPVLKGNRLFVPLRFISETFGAIINWDESNFTVNITIPYHYVEKYYYFHDIKIQVKGGDEKNNDSTGTKVIRLNKFEIKELLNHEYNLMLTIRRDLSADTFFEEIKDFIQILELNNFTKDDIEYLSNELTNTFFILGTYNKTYSANGYNILVEAQPNNNVFVYLKK